MIEPSPDIPFEIKGRRLILCVDHLAIHWFERHSGWSFMDIVLHGNEIVKGVESPKVSLLGFAMKAGLQKHHSEIELEQAFIWALDSEFMEALFKALSVSMPKAPPNPLDRAAKKRPPNGIGKSKSGRGAKRANV